MLDGRIDTQGTVKHLRSIGVLDEIAHDEHANAIEEPKVIKAEEVLEAAVTDDKKDSAAAAARSVKKARKLVEDEARATGNVKWSIYNTYLKAS